MNAFISRVDPISGVQCSPLLLPSKEKSPSPTLSLFSFLLSLSLSLSLASRRPTRPELTGKLRARQPPLLFSTKSLRWPRKKRDFQSREEKSFPFFPRVILSRAGFFYVLRETLFSFEIERQNMAEIKLRRNMTTGPSQDKVTFRLRHIRPMWVYGLREWMNTFVSGGVIFDM